MLLNQLCFFSQSHPGRLFHNFLLALQLSSLISFFLKYHCASDGSCFIETTTSQWSEFKKSSCTSTCVGYKWLLNVHVCFSTNNIEHCKALILIEPVWLLLPHTFHSFLIVYCGSRCHYWQERSSSFTTKSCVPGSLCVDVFALERLRFLSHDTAMWGPCCAVSHMCAAHWLSAEGGGFWACPLCTYVTC